MLGRKTDRMTRHPAWSRSLQWGRPMLGRKTKLQKDTVKSIGASMGPSNVRTENYFQIVKSHAPQSMLQWGRPMLGRKTHHGIAGS